MITTAGNGPGPDGRVTVALIVSGLSGVTFWKVMRVGPAQPASSAAVVSATSARVHMAAQHSGSRGSPPALREAGVESEGGGVVDELGRIDDARDEFQRAYEHQMAGRLDE